MNNKLAVTENKEARLAMQPEFSTEQIRLLAETVAKGCDQNELAFFLQVAKLKRLDPFTGQIHVVKRWDSQAGKDKITIQTGIDGYRVIAARTNDLAGIDDAIYDSEEGAHPNWAKVTVYRYGRSDDRISYTATARWGEYVQMVKDKQTQESRPNRMWKTMPFLMLGKVAEALALRKAFPDELSGMYTNEEMEQADSEGVTPASVTKPQVSMPKSTDEKKPAPKEVKAETVQQNQGPVQISGEIEKASPGKGQQEGSLWLVVNKKIICIPKDMVDAEMVPGAKVLIEAERAKGGTTEKYTATSVKMTVPPTIDGEVIEPDPQVVGQPDPLLAEADAHGLAGMFDEGQPPKKTAPAPAATEPAKATRLGTIGTKRAQRLYAIIGQNRKNTGFGEGELKKILSALPTPIEHLSDLEIGLYEEFEKMATGEVDWKQFLEE